MTRWFELLSERLHELVERGLELALGRVGQILGGADIGKDVRLIGAEIRQQRLFETGDLISRGGIQIAVHARDDRQHQLGRASWGASECQYGSLSVDAVFLQKKHK